MSYTELDPDWSVLPSRSRTQEARRGGVGWGLCQQPPAVGFITCEKVPDVVEGSAPHLARSHDLT